MAKKKVYNEFPPGWDEDRVKRVIASYQKEIDEFDSAVDEEKALETMENRRDLQEVLEALEDVKNNGAVPWKVVKQEVGLK